MKNKIAQTAGASILAAALMLSMAATAQAEDDSCSLAHAAGTYGVSDSGTVVGIGPRAAVARLTLDAAGNIAGTVTASLSGSITTGTVSGTYTVSPDCSGTTTFGEYDHLGNLIINATADLVWDDNMREFRFLFTSATLPNGTPLATALSGNGRKKK